jgi:SAM-dependent methyltransferase
VYKGYQPYQQAAGADGMANSAADHAWTSIEDLFDRTLGSRPSAHNLAIIKKAENERPEVKEFIHRALRLMAIANMPPTNMTPSLAWILGVMIPGLLPGAWGNVVPPFTILDRHKQINAYLAANPWGPFPKDTVLLEMGCGFPPQTAIDAARDFPHWQVIGADLQFDPYVLYDADGNYACMDSEGGVRYFHPNSANPANFFSLYGDTTATFQRFRAIFTALREKLPTSHDGQCVTIEHGGARLMHHPIRTYERPNLTLMQAGLGEETPTADIIRVFNVLFYFDAAFRSRAEVWALRTLRPGGLFLCGADGNQTLEARYSVYRKEHGNLVPKEFAFSLDNLRPSAVIPWFCLHDDEKETFVLARLLGVLRADQAFCGAYDSRMDELLAESRMLVRQQDGFLAAHPDQLPVSEWQPVYLAMQNKLQQEGFPNLAVSVLKHAGYNAWINPVGHIAVDPRGMASF